MTVRFKSAARLARWFGVPILTRKRIWLAYIVAGFTDGIQLALGPLGWAFVDETLDIVAMILISATLGFHFLLLPTFVIEFVPLADMLPTWTGCTAAVIMLRKRAQALPPRLPPEPPAPLSGPSSSSASTGVD